MQRRTIVSCGRRRIAGGCATQRWLLAVLRVIHLAFVLDAGKAGLHVVELRRRHDILRLCRQDGRDFFLRVLDAVSRRWVRFKSARESTGLLLIEGLYFLEEGKKGLRVIPGLVH